MAPATEASPWPIPTTIAPPAPSRKRRPSVSHSWQPSALATTGSPLPRAKTRLIGAPPWGSPNPSGSSLHVHPVRVELLADQPQLLGGGVGGDLEVVGDPEVPAGGGPDLRDAH